MEDIVMGVINAISQETGAAKWFVAVCLTIVVGIVLAVGFRAAFVYEVEFAQIGFIYNRVNGKIEKVPHPGYRIVYPFIEEGNTIDARPFQVCINANNRVLNCKLVQFDPKGLDVFLSLHGRDFQNNLTDILKSYAYDGSGKHYSFLRVIQEVRGETVSEYIVNGVKTNAGLYADPVTSH